MVSLIYEIARLSVAAYVLHITRIEFGTVLGVLFGIATYVAILKGEKIWKQIGEPK